MTIKLTPLMDLAAVSSYPEDIVFALWQNGHTFEDYVEEFLEYRYLVSRNNDITVFLEWPTCHCVAVEAVLC